MANKKAAQKDILNNERNRLRNVSNISKMKTSIKRAKKAITEQSDSKETELRSTLKLIDKVASKGIIHKNAAARYKSKLTLKFNEAATH